MTHDFTMEKAILELVIDFLMFEEFSSMLSSLDFALYTYDSKETIYFCPLCMHARNKNLSDQYPPMKNLYNLKKCHNCNKLLQYTLNIRFPFQIEKELDLANTEDEETRGFRLLRVAIYLSKCIKLYEELDEEGFRMGDSRDNFNFKAAITATLIKLTKCVDKNLPWELLI